MPISVTAGGPARYRNMHAPRTFFNSTIFCRLSDQLFAECNLEGFAERPGGCLSKLGRGLERHRGLCACTNVGCKMARELSRIVAGAVDQGRLAPPHERSAHQVEAGRRCDAAVMTDHALVVEHRHLQPSVVGSIAGCPDDGTNVALEKISEIHHQRRLIRHPRWRQAMWRLDLTVQVM